MKNNIVPHFKTIPLEEFKTIVEHSYSLSDVLQFCGHEAHGNYYKMIKKYLKETEIDTSHFIRGGRPVLAKEQNRINEMFVINSPWKRSSIKLFILKKKLIPYRCAECDTGPEWRKQKLVLILDHINGINNDNRLSNLRFLCPNCNSQTDTFCKRKSFPKTENWEFNIKNLPKKIIIEDEAIIKTLKNNNTIKSAAKSLGINVTYLKKICLNKKIDYKYYLTREYANLDILNENTEKTTFAELAKKYNTSKSNIINILNKETRFGWTKHSLEQLLNKYKSFAAVGKELKISGAAVKKRCIKSQVNYNEIFKKYNDIDIITLYLENPSISKIAKTLKADPVRIKKILNKHSIPIKDWKLSEETVFQIKSLLKLKLSSRIVAQRLNVSIHSVKKYKKELGLTNPKKE